MFADFYRHLLAKRLLNQRSASDEMEKTMIGKLKAICGQQFTSKLEVNTILIYYIIFNFLTRGCLTIW
jgi:hypothetical protein